MIWRIFCTTTSDNCCRCCLLLIWNSWCCCRCWCNWQLFVYISKLVTKIHVMCKVLDLITTSFTKKSPKMTIVEVVIKFITIYQLSYQYRLGMKLYWCCCCCSSSEETSSQQPHWLLQLTAGSSLLLSQYSFQKWH